LDRGNFGGWLDLLRRLWLQRNDLATHRFRDIGIFALARSELGFGGLDFGPGGLDLDPDALHVLDLHGTVGNSKAENGPEEGLGESDEEKFNG
jgi:hypothetical protein